MTQGANQKPPANSDNLNLQVDLEHSYAPGLPMPVAITISVAQPGTTINFISQPTPFDTRGAIGLKLVDAHGTVVVDEVPHRSIDLDHEQGLISISSGERMRFLIDISDMLAGIRNSGYYAMTLFYVHPMFVSRTQGLKFVIREPNAMESRWFARHRKDVEEAGSWAKWATEPPEKPEDLKPFENAPTLARFHAAFRYLAHTPAPLAHVAPQFLSGVTGVPRPEALLMEMEVYLAAEQTGSATRVAEQARSIAPAIDWLVEDSRNGAGLIAEIRSGP